MKIAITDYPSLTDDHLFKYLFSHKEILNDFLNSLFSYIKGEEVNIKYVCSEKLIEPNKNKHKSYYGDIVLGLLNGDIITLECYNDYGLNSFCKSKIYQSRLFGNQLKIKDKDYYKAPNVTSINIVRGSFHNQDKKLIKRYISKELESNEEEPRRVMEYITIYLDMVENEKYNEEEERLIKWLRVIKTKNIKEVEKMAKGDKVMEEMLEFLDYWYTDPEIQAMYNEDRYHEGRLKGKKEGRKEGKKEAMLEIAKNLLSKKIISYEDISEATGLSLKELDKLSNAN